MSIVADDCRAPSLPRQWLAASGYLALLLPPALLLAELHWRTPFLTVGSVLLFMPLARLVFGDVASEPTLWDGRVATALHWLPVAYGFALAATLCAAAIRLHQQPLQSSAESVGFGFALWIAMTFATCPAHELIHRRSAPQARFGRWIAGMAGYPILSFEHLAHHARCGDIEAAEWPRADESVWRFSARRVRVALRNAIVRASAANARFGRRHHGGLLEPSAFSVVACLVLGAGGGIAASTAYAVAALGVWFAIQLLTYLQHWGLGRDSVPDADRVRYAWEDRCRCQAWITLNISLHQAHHRTSDLPYYRIAPSPFAPRAPAGYVVLMFLCFLPACWQGLMRPALERWKTSAADDGNTGRRITCFR